MQLEKLSSHSHRVKGKNSHRTQFHQPSLCPLVQAGEPHVGIGQVWSTIPVSSTKLSWVLSHTTGGHLSNYLRMKHLDSRTREREASCHPREWGDIQEFQPE